MHYQELFLCLTFTTESITPVTINLRQYLFLEDIDNET
nr:MAG TPA: hypothetical protein [Caudoviricetes sp.]